VNGIALLLAEFFDSIRCVFASDRMILGYVSSYVRNLMPAGDTESRITLAEIPYLPSTFTIYLLTE
jgi:hypothetical protein